MGWCGVRLNIAVGWSGCALGVLRRSIKALQPLYALPNPKKHCKGTLALKAGAGLTGEREPAMDGRGEARRSGGRALLRVRAAWMPRAASALGRYVMSEANSFMGEGAARRVGEGKPSPCFAVSRFGDLSTGRGGRNKVERR